MERRESSLVRSASPVQGLDFWGELLLKGLLAGHTTLERAESALAEGLALGHPLIRTQMEAYAVALYRGSLDRSAVSAPWWGVLGGPAPPAAGPVSRGMDDPMEFESRAERARQLVSRLPRGRVRRLEAVNLRPSQYRGAAVARVFLERALAALPGDPRESANWAELAALAAGSSTTAQLPGEDQTELEALAFRADVYQGNALRALGDLAGAEKILAGAVVGARRNRVTDVRFWAEEKAFRASLRRDQRRFDEAIREGLLASAIFRVLGEGRWQVTQLWQLASIHEQLGDHRAALSTIREAIPASSGLEDDRLKLGVRQMELLALARCGLFDEAEAALSSLAALFDRFPEERPWRLGISALVNAGLRHFVEAEADFRASRDGFLASKNAYDAALVTLDWSLFLLDQDRAEEVLPLAVSMGQAFEALGVARETLASWAIFQAAAERRELTRAVTESLVRTLGEERAGVKPKA